MERKGKKNDKEELSVTLHTLIAHMCFRQQADGPETAFNTSVYENRNYQ